MTDPPESGGVAATITLPDAAGHAWDAVVVGAGPAGAATAWRLAARGVRTLLVDRREFPRAKVCGSCLSPRAVRELHDLGPGALPGAAIPLAAARLVHRGRCAEIPLPAGRVVSRDALDTRLVRSAIAAGCAWLPGVSVSAIVDSPRESSARLLCSGGPSTADYAHSTLRGSVVILAGGLADAVRIDGGTGRDDGGGRCVASGSRIGVGAVVPAELSDLPPGRLVMAVGRHGYCGIVRLEDGRIDVAAALDRAAVARDPSPARAVADILHDAADSGAFRRFDVETLRRLPFRATPPLTHRAPLVAGAARRILRVGDAAGYVEPFTGEGIGWALSAARLLAESLLAGSDLRPAAEAARRYVEAHGTAFGGAHARCRLVAVNLRRPAVVAAAVAGARALPWAAQVLAPLVVGADAVRGDA